mgnify:CR=1 FL=1
MERGGELWALLLLHRTSATEMPIALQIWARTDSRESHARRWTGGTCHHYARDGLLSAPGFTERYRGGPGELREAVYTQRNATFRGAEFQSQLDVAPLGVVGEVEVLRRPGGRDGGELAAAGRALELVRRGARHRDGHWLNLIVAPLSA